MAWKIILVSTAVVAGLIVLLIQLHNDSAATDTSDPSFISNTEILQDTSITISAAPTPSAQTIVRGCDADSTEKAQEDEVEEMRVRFSIAIKAGALILSYMLAYYMRKYRLNFLPEVGVAVVIGALVGLVLRLLDSGKKFTELAQLDPELFFNILLPPMILDAGFNMKRQAFFRNIFGITFFAFVGTLVTAFVTGGAIHLLGITGWVDDIGFIESLLYGTITASTEPTVVLAVLKSANIDLFSVSVGESVFNDATTMVLFHTLLKHKCNSYKLSTIFSAIGLFIGTLLGSCAIGLGFALLYSLLFKHLNMYEDIEFLFMETSLLVLCPYSAFLAAEAAGLSGIAAILFCGLAMAHYTSVNISDKARTYYSSLVSTVSSLSATLVFVYIGAATFTFDHSVSGISFVPFILLAAWITRALHIIPGIFIINLFRKPDREPLPILWSEAFIIWCAGARGSLSFVLAVSSWVNSEVTHAKDMLTGTLFLVVITVLFQGGGTPAILSLLKIPPRTEDQEVERQHTSRAEINASRFLTFDRRYMKPFFTRMPTAYVNVGEGRVLTAASGTPTSSPKNTGISNKATDHVSDVENNSEEPVNGTSKHREEEVE